jgi:dienelactone hydrolase
MSNLFRGSMISVLLVIFLGGCASASSTPSELQTITSSAVAATATLEQAQMPPDASSLPVAVEYNLGETTITQAIFPEGNRFRYMPVQLNGIIAVPEKGNGPYPVVVIMHGNHPGCPIPDGDMVDRWPCDPGVERPNYRGFDYLVRQLAAQGYVALSINVNADNTLGFGEPNHIERFEQLVDLHLKALAEASDGGSNLFGVDLKNQADMHRLAFIGHSQGGEGAYWLTQNSSLDAQETFTKRRYGPVYGLILVAPSANFAGAAAARVPIAVILPSCDADVFTQDGQLFYEITRGDPKHVSWATSIWLERANHNYFNSTLPDERMGRQGRPDCEPILQPEAQQGFLSSYAIDFLAKIFNRNPGADSTLGMDPGTVATDELFGLPARIAALAASSDRMPLLHPSDASELTRNLAGGSVTAENLSVFFCEEGYFVPWMKPGSEPCKRVNLIIPANPAMIVASWSQQGAAVRFSLPAGSDIRQYSAVSLRAALDPLSTLNPAGAPQAFTIKVVDTRGKSASVRTQIDEPALRFPEGNKEENDTFEGGWFTGRVPLTSIRIPLQDFKGVDLSNVREISLVFDQNPSGSLFISDIELVR